MTLRSSGQSGIIVIPSSCQMISQAGPTVVGNNQVTQLIAPSSNPNGMRLISLYTQIVQNNNPSTNTAQSLIIAALTAPVDFSNKSNCFAIFRTFQDGTETPIAPGGGSPAEIVNIELPTGWGIWQVVSVTGMALNRNNTRLSFVLY